MAKQPVKFDSRAMCNVCGRWTNDTVQRLVRVGEGRENQAGMFKVLRVCAECAKKHGIK